MLKRTAILCWGALAAVVPLLCIPAYLAAEEVQSRSAIVEQLTPEVRTRGLVLVEDSEPASMSFSNVQFLLDSYDLTDIAEQQVIEIAAALNDSALTDFRFEIVGHTDATGSDSYNQTLSDARAASVRNRLVELGVAPERLQSQGLGETQLLEDLAPDDPAQRRVELINLGR